MRDVTFATTFVASSNSTGTVEVFRNTEGQAVDLDRVTMFKENAAIGDLTVGTFAGEKRLAPDNENLALGPNPVEMEIDEPVGPDGTVEARFINTGGNAPGVTVIVHGQKKGE